MKRKIIDKVNLILIYTSATICLLTMIGIAYFILKNGLAYVSLDFIFGDYRSGGILNMIVGTLYIVLLSILIATPIGILTALYLNEYAKENKWSRILRFAIDGLVSVPSIVYGLFGFSLFVTVLKFKYSILSGSLTLTIMILPVIIKTVEEALKSVPNEIREGSLALGASKVQTLIKVVIPASLSGIVTAIILAIGRVISESAPLILTAGMVARMPNSIMDSSRTLTTHLYYLASEGTSNEALNEAYATACVLLIVIIFINIMTKLIAKFIEKKVG
ncbi:MAG: phosphate ABC transporter permease PstA [Erysipelotrichaceae bacterium]